ncbi:MULTISPECIES: 4'-phosphopantetheinyl transferase [unclassified Streptomyces]|uniref:4'-phosphopantetheinyl transferase family protein n=1 Tax=unclassified Streptomyces TaxID=2593676 RepID=UPI001BE63599|nr:MULTISPECIES: 4'-phosphopantetheinyl transferase superfamily protein [unclassified Streptomyces]MBT2408578.1 4'-phosphopantetheinyl transferase superfamily protein [Streptomyces sp. ISL-21]MBT2458191.1 4'-phosphopantetheinyl transferase superfamily protein [Streptomyces sp. ISL-86]MBT2608738.1 4'-phosphopantetheinyl transferase superfamily protein [Streptomyces sp. ISL-87]
MSELLSTAGRLATVVPAGVSTAEAFGDLEPLYEFPAETGLIVGVVDSRRREFLTARRCAHEALARLGRTAVPVGRDSDRAPVWPHGVVGSITHCDGYRAAAVAEDRDVVALGIDAEPNRDLAPGVAELVLRPTEALHLDSLQRDGPALAWPTLAFCAKEAIYKAWYPTARRRLDFQDVEVRFEPTRRSFVGRFLAADRTRRELSGRYIFDDDLVIAAVVVGSATGRADQYLT